MTGDDIAQVMDVERESFPSMWPQTAYRRELGNKIARYAVISEPAPADMEAAPAEGWLRGSLRRIVGADAPAPADERVLGFMGLWLMVGEVHIVTVAVREHYRRMGIAVLLMIWGI
jgi:ribosomal-protein-alanine N-acetyltransferase